MDKKKKVRPLRQWSVDNMTKAYQSVLNGQLSVAAAAKKFGVPRMTLSDRVSGKVSFLQKWVRLHTYLPMMKTHCVDI